MTTDTVARGFGRAVYPARPTGISHGEPVWCVPCAGGRFPERAHRGAVLRDEEGREAHAVLQEGRPFEREERCVECDVLVIGTHTPLPREEPGGRVV